MRPARSVLLAGFALLLFASLPASALRVVPSTTATFGWERARGPVAGYAVYVSRDGDTFPPVPEAVTGQDQTQAILDGLPGETILVRVAAYDRRGGLGPFSPISEPIVFSDGTELDLDLDDDGSPDLICTTVPR